MPVGIFPLHDAGVLEALPPEVGNSVQKCEYSFKNEADKKYVQLAYLLTALLTMLPEVANGCFPKSPLCCS